jgi:nucleotide-binding universal stress UspA family protein
VEAVNGLSHVTGRVVVGVHGTPGSLQALRFAVEQARMFDAVLVPVIAWQPPGGDSTGRHYPDYLCDEWADMAEDRLVAAFDEGLGSAPDDLQVKPLVIRGPVGRVLVAVAEHSSDLLILGHSRRGPVYSALYGSPTRHCLKHARCSVIIVPASPLAQATVRRWSGRHLRRAPHDGSQIAAPIPRPTQAPHRST